MKVQIKVTVEVDAEQWMAEYGCERDEVRDEVQAYFRNAIQASAAVDDSGVVRVA